MKADVLVVGSGISGAGAALSAARAGSQVVLVRRSYGATAMASGAVAIGVQASGKQPTPGLDRPADVLVDMLTEVLPLSSLGRRKSFLNVLGRVIEADAIFPTMARGALDSLEGKRLAVVGFKGMTEVRPDPVARAARAVGVDADVVRMPFPELKHTHDVSTPEIARMCDDLTPVEKLVTALVESTAGFDMVALPPALGLYQWEKVAAILDDALGKRWFELVAALPSVPGMRLQQSLDARLHRAGIDVVHGPVLSWTGMDRSVTGLRAGVSMGEQTIATKQVVLATGGLIGRGLRVSGDQVREALLDLPVEFEPIETGVDMPRELSAGVRVDDQLRPLDDASEPAFDNVRVAGELAGLTFGSGQGGLAVGLATGWLAGELAAEAAKTSESREAKGPWQSVEPDDDPLGCLNCGLCLSRCPTVRALAREKQTYPGPRGMMSGLTRFESELDEIADELSLCTLCGACSVVCPACVPVPENITRARQILGRIAPDAGPSAYQALRGAFDTPKRLFDAEPVDGPRKDHAESVLFIGCSLPYYEREHAEGTITLLEALGVDFTLIDEVCCGGPLEVIGAEGAQAMAAHNVSEFRRVGARRVISCCPRCAETMATTPAYSDFEIEHTTTLLARLLPGTQVATKLRERVGGQTVTFHDPCERARLAGEVKAARDVMAAVGLEVAEMPRSGTFTDCCGAGGGVRAAQTKTSIRMARLRVVDALSTGAPLLLTECPSCLHNLYNGRKRKQNLEISNLSSYLGSQLG